MIEVQNLVKRYGSFRALDAISFNVEGGEVVGFLGPNGAGKTTAMRILTGYMPPTSGTVMVAGFDIFTDSISARQHIGYLPETVPVYPDMTVKGYLAFIASLRGVAPVKNAVARTLEQVGLTERASSLVRNISKGMRQRLGLAQALVHDPAVLILDEPTIGLDPHQVREVRQLVKSLGERHTVLFSTHILSEAEQLCDRVIILHQGAIVARDKPDTLREQLQRGQRRTFIRVRGSSEQALKALQQLSEVEEALLSQGGIIVTAASNQEIRPTLARTLLQQKLELLELRPLAMNLEDMFVELIE